MPSIRISQQTLRRIEDRAKPFEDTEPEDVIRRLLDKTEADQPEMRTNGRSPADLVSRGGRIPHGSELRMKYKGREYRAVVDDGRIVWNGETYSSPSKAAVAVIQSTGTERNTADGWRHWEVKTPKSGMWRLADDIRSDEDPQLDLDEYSEELAEKLKNDPDLREDLREVKRRFERLSEEQKDEVREWLKGEIDEGQREGH